MKKPKGIEAWAPQDSLENHESGDAFFGTDRSVYPERFKFKKSPTVLQAVLAFLRNFWRKLGEP